MDTTVSTSAFDAIITLEESLAMWTARGFASGSRCGFDLTIATTAAAADALSTLPRPGRWWDEPDNDTFPMTLTADGIRLALSLNPSSTRGTQTDKDLEFCLSVTFPTPRDCTTLILTVDDFWSTSARVVLDPTILTRDLARWQRRHQP